MKDLEKGLKEFAKALKKAKQDKQVHGYALIGGMAVSARARPRATKDIDFLVNAEPSFFTDVLPKWITNKGYTFKQFTADRLDPLNGLVRIFDPDGNEWVDMIPVFWQWQQETIETAEEIEIFEGVSIPIAKAEDLVVLKLKAGNAQDMLDAEELLKAAIANKLLDKNRLHLLSKRARVDKKLNTLLSNLQKNGKP